MRTRDPAALPTWGDREPFVIESPTVRYTWQGVPAGVQIIRDQVFKTIGDRELILDVYMPELVDEPLPAIVWISGGGWKQMGRFGPQRISAWLAAHGYAIIGFEYRVSGEAIFPACIEDCKAAVRWVRANAAEHMLDPDRVGCWGDSAGGHLAALLANTPDVDELQREGPNLQYSTHVSAAVAIFPPCDLRNMVTARDSVVALMGGPIEQRRDAYELASPAAHVRRDCPPHLLIHGTADEIVPYQQSVDYHARLLDAGVESTLVQVPGVGHDGRVHGNEEAKAIIRAFFDRHLKGAE